MTYQVRNLLHPSPPTVPQSTLSAPAGRGGPSLIDVFARHPDWRRRLIVILNRGVSRTSASLHRQHHLGV